MNTDQLGIIQAALDLLRDPEAFNKWQRDMFRDAGANEVAVYRMYPALEFHLAAEYLETMLNVEAEWELIVIGRNTTLRVHARKNCTPPCPVHSPSDHHMKSWPLWWRSDRRIFERLCPGVGHGVGHPDPDTMRFINEQQGGRDRGSHGCDGCCRPPAHTQPRSIAA